ncbi:MAG: hypothetical protein M3N45_06635 [Actinomycetota bacterium]|nr:hypothetical protein [Actinomycetota bacterium]
MSFFRKIVTPVALLAGLMLVATLIPGGTLNAAGAEDSAVLTHTDLDPLELGGSVFDKGEYVVASRGGFPGAFAYYAAPHEDQAAADPCLTKSGYCRLYKVDVNEVGGTLRVAMESSKRGECFALELRDPDDKRAPGTGFPYVCPELAFSAQAFNIEISVPNATKGSWEIRVLGPEVDDWAYRVRAALEGAPPGEPDLLTPNLTPWVPSEFGFVAPASPTPGTALDHRNPPGPPGTRCHPEQELEVQHNQCLRFSAGLYNNGDGPLYLKFSETDAYQHVYYSDGSPGQYHDNETQHNYLEVEAGPAEWHDDHGHRHFKDMVLYQLFSVSDDPVSPPYQQGKALTEVGVGNKHGYCTFSQRIERWSDFAQDHQFASFPSWEDACDKAMTLERGWGDLYRWQRPGQYVAYDGVADPDGTMRAGFYVVRVTVDPKDLLLETKESDNRAYAYIRVLDGLLPDSDRIIVCEQGYGKSPWDPSKTVVEDTFLWAKQLKDPAFQPEAC